MKCRSGIQHCSKQCSWSCTPMRRCRFFEDAEKAKTSADSYESSEDDAEPLPEVKRRRILGKSRDPGYEVQSVAPAPPPPSRSSEALGERCGLPAMVVRRAKRLKVPSWVFTIMSLLMMNAHVCCTPRFHAVEFYSGAATIYNAYERVGLRAAKVHNKYTDDPTYDFTTPEGLVCLIFYVMCLHMRGLNFHAVVCSTWVWMSRNSTGRTHSRPKGNDTEVVRQANLMVTRMCLAMRLASAKFCRWGVEQPATSCLPRFKSASAGRCFTKVDEWQNPTMPCEHGCLRCSDSEANPFDRQ